MDVEPLDNVTPSQNSSEGSKKLQMAAIVTALRHRDAEPDFDTSGDAE